MDRQDLIMLLSDFMENETRSCSMDFGGITPIYVYRMWNGSVALEDMKVKGQENAYKTIVSGAVGGAAGVIHVAESATTDCQPNDNVEALRVALDKAGIEARPVWKPMHKQPVYEGRRLMDEG